MKFKLKQLKRYCNYCSKVYYTTDGSIRFCSESCRLLSKKEIKNKLNQN